MFRNRRFSAMDKVTCPKCGQEIETGRMRCEENVIGVSDHQVIFVSRKFEADCPQCGPVLCHSVGHHGTIAKKELKTLFPKPQLVRRKLSKDERKLFDQTM